MSEISEKAGRARAEGDCQNWPDRELMVFETLFLIFFPKRRKLVCPNQNTTKNAYVLVNRVHSMDNACNAPPPSALWYRFDTHCWDKGEIQITTSKGHQQDDI
jgi:hypothetical protein